MENYLLSLIFTRPVIMSLVHGVSTVTKHDKWSYKSQKKGAGHVFYMATASHATGSVGLKNPIDTFALNSKGCTNVRS